MKYWLDDDILKEAKKRKSRYVATVQDQYDYDIYHLFIGGPKDEYRYPSNVMRSIHGKNMQWVYDIVKVDS